jgi:hypothetical protein
MAAITPAAATATAAAAATITATTATISWGIDTCDYTATAATGVSRHYFLSSPFPCPLEVA